MNAGNLDTTNLLLAIMAAVSVLEAILLIGLGVMAYRLYGHAMRTIREIAHRTPLDLREVKLLRAIAIEVTKYGERLARSRLHVDG